MSYPYEPPTPYRAPDPDSPRVLGDERSIGEIVGDLGQDLSTLMRQEVALAKAEASQTVKHYGAGAGMFAGAAVGALMVATFLSLALWWAIGAAIGSAAEPALAISGLIVAVIWAIIAAILVAIGRSQMKKAPGVEQTKESLTQIPDALKGDEEKNR